MLKRFLLICVITWMYKPVMAQQDTPRVSLLEQYSDRFFFKPDRNSTDLDSSLWYTRQAEKLSNKLNYQKGLGDSYERQSKILHIQGDAEKGKNYITKAIQIFSKNNYPLDLGYAWYELSSYYSIYDSSLNERIRIDRQSLAAFQKAGAKQKMADVYRELADLEQLNGDYITSLSHLKLALELYQSINYPYLQGTYDLMGSVFEALGDYEHGLKYGLLAIKTADQLKDSSLQVATIYNRVGIIYEQTAKPRQAYEYYKRSLDIGRQCKDTQTIIILTGNISQVLVAMNRPRESLAVLQTLSKEYPKKYDPFQLTIATKYLYTYNTLKQYDKGRPYCDQLLKISATLRPDDPDQGLIYDAVVQFFLATSHIDQARKYLLLYDALGEKSHQLRAQAKVQLLWFKLDSTMGDYKAAIPHYQHYKAFRDSALNERSNRQIEQLKLEFETEKKDKDIALKEKNIELLTNQSLLQQSGLKQATLTRNVTLAGTALLLISLILLYKYLQNRIRSHKQLQAQKKEIEAKNISLQHLLSEKEWLIKEIHHRVKNNFHMVNGLLGTQLGYLKTDEAIDAIGESQRRVQTMALIHQKLYQSESLSAINMKTYIYELVDYLCDSFTISKTIRFHLKVDPIELDLAHCIPLGLILNEAITNAIKYAFHKDQNRIITITFRYKDPMELLLVVADNGAGLPPGFDTDAGNTMGMNLMRGLTEDVEGTFMINNNNGAEIRIVFPYQPHTKTNTNPANLENSIL